MNKSLGTPIKPPDPWVQKNLPDSRERSGLATAFYGNTVERSESAGLQLTDDEADELRCWIQPGDSARRS
jgi:hypothetical protein